MAMDSVVPGGAVSLPIVTGAAPSGTFNRNGQHWAFLLLALVVIALSAALQVVNGERVAFWFQARSTLPDLCFSRILFGADCPGCGLTRSLVSLTHGDWQAAWRFHRLGWLVAALTWAQIPYRIIALRSERSFPAHLNLWICWGTILLLLVNWVGKTAGW